MNKLLAYLLLCGAMHCYAQTDLDTTSVVADTLSGTEAVQAHLGLQAADSLTYTNRTFSPGFKDKYKSDEFKYETKTVAKSWWDRFWEAVGNFLRNIFSFGDGTQPVFNVLKFIIAFAVIGFAIYMIVRAILGKEAMWIFSRSRRGISIENITEEDIRTTDFKQLISETKNAANYRLAIRYYYLWLLKRLSLGEVIDWHKDKTNSDYLYEIKNEALRKDFEYLSYIYDYSWYGEFPIDEVAFSKAEKVFTQTINTI